MQVFTQLTGINVIGYHQTIIYTSRYHRTQKYTRCRHLQLHRPLDKSDLYCLHSRQGWAPKAIDLRHYINHNTPSLRGCAVLPESGWNEPFNVNSRRLLCVLRNGAVQFIVWTPLLGLHVRDHAYADPTKG